MLLAAAAEGSALQAADIAAVLVERGLGGNNADIATRLSRFQSDRGRRAEDMRRLARGWARLAETEANGSGASAVARPSPAALLALAYPDRIAKARGTGRQYLLAGGRGAGCPTAIRWRGPLLVIAELMGAAASGRIGLAAELDERELIDIAGHRITETIEHTFDRGAAAVAAVGCDGSAPSCSPPSRAPRGRRGGSRDSVRRHRRARRRGAALEQGPAAFAPSRGFLRAGVGEPWPDLWTPRSMKRAATGSGRTSRPRPRSAEIAADDLDHAFAVLLPWDLRRRLDQEAPSHFEAPTGNSHAIDYDGPQAPMLSIRVQELFGLDTHPALAGGRLPLTLELLSPAHRPIQVTRDLPGFWAGSWRDVRTDMRGRYPRHVWPENPATANPTTRAKPRGT